MSRPALSILFPFALIALLLVLVPEAVLAAFAGAMLAVGWRRAAVWMRHRTGLPLWATLTVVPVALVALLVATGVFAAPVIADEARLLAAQFPQAGAAVQERIADYPWLNDMIQRLDTSSLASAGKEAAGTATAVLGNIFGGLGTTVTVALLAIYAAAEPRVYRLGIVALAAPTIREDADRLVSSSADALSAWLGAQLVAMAVVGLLTWVGLMLLGVKLSAVLALITALLTFIPVLGPVMAAVPAVVLALADSPALAVQVALLYVGVQAVEGNLVTPMLQSHAVDMPPALLLLMQLVLGTLFGLLGLVVAAPLTAVAIAAGRDVYVKRWLERREG